LSIGILEKISVRVPIHDLWKSNIG